MTPILYHANCPDGFSAAWVTDRNVADAALIPMNYGDPVPDIVEGQRVFLVDFCFEPDELVELCLRARAVTILDHHHTAAGYLADPSVDIPVFDSVSAVPSVNVPVKLAVIDQSRSGVGIAMEWFGDTGHEWLLRIEDRDLWRWELPDTADVFAHATSMPYTIEAWDTLDGTPLETMVEAGKAINRYRDQLIEAAVAQAFLIHLPGLGQVMAAPCPYAIGSDVAGRLAQFHIDGVGSYFMVQKGSVRFGLRSRPNGEDVAALAARFGGGGHIHASGFEVSIEEFVSWLA